MRLPNQSEGVRRTVFIMPIRVRVVPAAMRDDPHGASRAVSRLVSRGGLPGLSTRGLGFKDCGFFECVCSGDRDCNDLFSSSACSDIAYCDETGGQVICWCIRQDVLIPA